MGTVTGTLDRPLEESMAATRDVAARQGYSLAEGQGGSNELVFKMGAKLWSWGSQLMIRFDEVSPSQTRLLIQPGETFAVTDWGRGKRAAVRLLDALGATR
jgi:hypothetical protein